MCKFAYAICKYVYFDNKNKHLDYGGSKDVETHHDAYCTNHKVKLNAARGLHFSNFAALFILQCPV